MIEETRASGTKEKDTVVETSEKQIEELQARIEAIRRTRDATVETIEEATKQQLEPLWDEQKSLEKELEAQRDLAAPVRKIPVELLAELFVAHVEDGGEIADIALTCKLWCDVAFRTAKVWSRISIRLRRRSRWRLGRLSSGDRMQFPCHKHSVLEQILKRSGNSLLTIDLDFGQDLEPKDDPEAAKMMHTLNDGAFSRCTSLTLRSSPRAEWTLAHTYTERWKNDPDFQIPFQHFPKLEALVVEHGWNSKSVLSSLLTIVEDTAPALRSLIIKAQFTENLLEGRSKLLERLHDMRFRGYGLATSSVKLSRNTTALHLRDVMLDLDPLDNNPFPSLQRANVDWDLMNSFEGRTFPSIAKLKIDTSVRDRIENVAVQFPALRELAIEGPGWQLARQFSHSSEFTTLHLGDRYQKKKEGNMALKELWDGTASQPRPSILRIYICMSEAAFISAMKKLPDLRELCIDTDHDFTLKDRFFGELAGSSRKSDNTRQWKLLPKLERLVLNVHSLFAMECPFKQRIPDMVKGREGSRLRSIRLYYEDRDNQIEDGTAPYEEFLIAQNCS